MVSNTPMVPIFLSPRAQPTHKVGQDVGHIRRVQTSSLADDAVRAETFSAFAFVYEFGT